MEKKESMRNINPFGLRLQPELKAAIERAAEKNGRSINAEIHARLEESFFGGDPSPAQRYVDEAMLQAVRDKAETAIAALMDDERVKIIQAIREEMRGMGARKPSPADDSDEPTVKRIARTAPKA